MLAEARCTRDAGLRCTRSSGRPPVLESGSVGFADAWEKKMSSRAAGENNRPEFAEYGGPATLRLSLGIDYNLSDVHHHTRLAITSHGELCRGSFDHLCVRMTRSRAKDGAE
jgi:hypothetical protein